MTTWNRARFARRVATTGPAQHMTFTGQFRGTTDPVRDNVPLIVALHGGGYTSSYFDVPGYSLLDRANALGLPALAIDRPGYAGSSAAPDGDSIFLSNGAVLAHAITELWQEVGGSAAGIVLIGHSIGAPVALAIAAQRPSWLLGIAISGCLLRNPNRFATDWSAQPGRFLDSPIEDKASRMFGDEGAFYDDMPQASYFANVPVLTAELQESAERWPGIFRELAPQIAVPVQLRQGAEDALWVGGDDLATFANSLSTSACVDAAFVPDAGHAIDFHKAGAAFQTEQLAFALKVAATGRHPLG